VANSLVAARSWLPAPFRVPGFAGLWISASSGSFGRVISQLALSWITLEVTGSPFLVGVIGAARMVPQMVLGIPAGALADHVSRRTIIVATNAATVGLTLVLIALAVADSLLTPILIAVSVAYGILDTVRITATQSYAYDLVRAGRATSGMAMTSLGVQLLSMIGGLVGGYTLQQFGHVSTFGLIAAAMLIATAAPLLWVGPAQAGKVPVPAGPDGGAEPAPRAPARRTGVDLGRAATLFLRNRLLAILALAIILAEIFGFATQTLLPTFARDVFDVGAAGLGLMMAARSGGGTLGLLVLSRIGAEGRAGLIFLITGGAFGLALLLMAISPFYALALLLLAVSGFCASIMDTLGQTLIQRNADEHERGAAMGLWVVSVGFGPVGHLALGAAASTFGAPASQVVSGLLLMAVASTLLLHGPLRRAR
jgi:MFS family permease